MEDDIRRRFNKMDERIDTLTEQVISVVQMNNTNVETINSILNTQQLILSSIDSVIQELQVLKHLMSPLQPKSDTNRN